MPDEPSPLHTAVALAARLDRMLNIAVENHLKLLRIISAHEKDIKRLEWVMPILDGEGDQDLRTQLLAIALGEGRVGRAAIDRAIQLQNSAAVK